MKKIITSLSAFAVAITVNAQQIDNSGFETWEAVGGSSEPTSWNGFLSADGSLAWAAQSQVAESSDTRPGSSGVKSAKIWSRSAFGIIANGNLTLGKIRMGSSTPTSPDNYNRTVVAEADFNQPLTQSPDSIVFWTKFIPSSGSATDLARFRATLHDNYDCKDPADNASLPHIDALATLDFSQTGGQWVRKSIAIDYTTGSATSHDYILVSISTNATAGGGSGGDTLYVDDIELIYNPVAVVISEGTLQNPTTCGGNDGSIEVTGTGTGDISWSGAASGTQSGVTLPYVITGLSAGTYTIDFNNGAASTPFTSTLTDPGAPTVTMSLFSSDTICSSDSIIALTATPAGGTFSGDGVSGTDFNPATANVNATNTVVYTVVESGCTGTASESVYVKSCSTTFINENVATQFSIAPNPTTDFVKIQLSNKVEGTISLIDMTGKVVLEKAISGIENSISLTAFNKGLYFVQVKEENGTQSSKRLIVK